MRRKAALIGGLVTAAVLGGVITVAYVVHYTDGERPGVAFAGIDTFDSAHDADVKLPIGTLKVQIGTPSQDYDVDFQKTERAADGAVIVPVGWELEGAQAGIENITPTYQFQLTLVAGGRRYDLQAGHEDENDSSSTSSQPIVASGRVATVVEGDGEDLDLEVEYDGLTQVLDVDSGKIDSGLAAPYYAPGGLTRLTAAKSCTAVSEADQKAYVVSLNKCSLGPVTLIPYVGGFGWVGSKSESWAAVPYSLQVGSIDARGSGKGRYATELRRFDVTLDGAKPTADILRYRNRNSVIIAGYKVFKTSTTPTTLGLSTELLGDSRFNGSGTRTFRTTQTLPLT